MRIAVLLHDVARHFRYAFETRARSLGVTRPQYRAMLLISRKPGLTQSELADMLDVERITLGRMIDRMASAGLVERRADPADRRVWRLHLLPGSDPLIKQLENISAEVMAELLAHLAPTEQQQLQGLLTKLDEGARAARCDKARAA